MAEVGDLEVDEEKRYMHEKMVEMIKGLCWRIRGGIPIEGRDRQIYKMVDQDAEKELRAIAKMYQLKTGYLPSDVFEKLIKAFQECLEVVKHFWWLDTKDIIEETIKNLETMKEERSLEKYEMVRTTR